MLGGYWLAGRSPLGYWIVDSVVIIHYIILVVFLNNYYCGSHPIIPLCLAFGEPHLKFYGVAVWS